MEPISPNIRSTRNSSEHKSNQLEEYENFTPVVHCDPLPLSAETTRNGGEHKSDQVEEYENFTTSSALPLSAETPGWISGHLPQCR